MQPHDPAEKMREAFRRLGQPVPLYITEHHQRACDHRGMEILSFQQAQIAVIEQAILAEIDALLKAETRLLNDAAAVEFVTVGIDQKIPAPDIFVRKLGDIVIGSVRNGPEFTVPFQMDTFDAQDIETRLLFQQWQALLQESLFQAVVAVQKSDILSAGKIQPVISCSRDSGNDEG